MTLGLTDGTYNFGIISDNGSETNTVTGIYNKNIGFSSWTKEVVAKGIGVTTDPTKSGLIAPLLGLTLGTVPSEKLGNFYIRY